MSIKNWRIYVNENKITFRSAFGKTSSYTFDDISEVTDEAKAVGATGHKYIFYLGDGSKMFSIDENTDPLFLIDRVIEKGIPVKSV